MDFDEDELFLSEQDEAVDEDVLFEDEEEEDFADDMLFFEAEENLVTVPQDFRWSFSKLSLYEHCPAAFKQEYLQEGVQKRDNAFGEYGTLCHKVLEDYAKGNLFIFQLPEEYKRLFFAEIKHDFPPFPKGYPEKTFQQGWDYFSEFEGFGDEYDILAVEDKFVLDIQGERFSGIADLVLKHKTSGEIVVVDHKTKSPAMMKKDLPMYRRQLYIYAAYVLQKFGRYPSLLRFNMIKSKEYIDERFDKVAYEETLRWVVDTIGKIRADKTWVAKPSEYFCKFICSTMPDCRLYR